MVVGGESLRGLEDTSPRGPGPAYDEDPVIDVRGLTIRYDDEVALQDATFQVFRHEIFGIIGPANSGKTSFL